MLPLPPRQREEVATVDYVFDVSKVLIALVKAVVRYLKKRRRPPG